MEYLQEGDSYGIFEKRKTTYGKNGFTSTMEKRELFGKLNQNRH